MHIAVEDMVSQSNWNPNKALTKNAPASCEDLQLTTTSQIGVSKSSNQYGPPFMKGGHKERDVYHARERCFIQKNRP